MPECQINYFISTINLFYVGEITDSDDIYCPGLSIKYKKRRITCNSLIPVADLFVQIAKTLVVYNGAKSLDLTLEFIKIKSKHMEPHLCEYFDNMCVSMSQFPILTVQIPSNALNCRYKYCFQNYLNRKNGNQINSRFYFYPSALNQFNKKWELSINEDALASRTRRQRPCVTCT